jgi:hypothetical protein
MHLTDFSPLDRYWRLPPGQEAKGDAQQLKGDAKNAVKDGVNKVADEANKKL